MAGNAAAMVVVVEVEEEIRGASKSLLTYPGPADKQARQTRRDKQDMQQEADDDGSQNIRTLEYSQSLYVHACVHSCIHTYMDAMYSYAPTSLEEGV